MPWLATAKASSAQRRQAISCCCTHADGEEAEQEQEHQHRGDLQYAKDFAGDLLQIFEYHGVVFTAQPAISFMSHIHLRTLIIIHD